MSSLIVCFMMHVPQPPWAPIQCRAAAVKHVRLVFGITGGNSDFYVQGSYFFQKKISKIGQRWNIV